MPYFRTRALAIDDKADSSPVTVADRECEWALRAVVAEEQPGHGVVGEEMASTRADAEWVWVIDPIDGTKSFVTGKPLFGTLIALLRQGRPILGIIDHPAIDVRYLGIAGRPTTRNGEVVRVRSCDALKDAWLYATTPEMFRPGAEADAFARLKKKVKHPVFGAECLAYGLLAEGFVDLVCEATMKPVDYLPLVAVVEGAGGIITDWRGRPLGLDSEGQVLAAGDRRRHAEAMAALAGA
ncbi:MAG: histidinol phosphate phosphatase [Rhodospirillales bacterium]|nr:histidinol phosphate phosphatase [Rhodospirillales bacterium]